MDPEGGRFAFGGTLAGTSFVVEVYVQRAQAVARAPRAVLAAIAAVATVAAPGCGASGFRVPVYGGAAALSESDRSERLALGAIDPDLAGEPGEEVARLRRIAALELRVGNHGLAIEAMLRALRIARARAALATDGERGSAEDRYREAREEAIALAERAGSLELALEAAGRSEPSGSARDAIARLVRLRADAGGSLAGLVVAEPLARVLDDAARLDLERLGVELGPARLTVERIAALGARALPVLHARLRAAARREDGAEISTIARAIRELDRWDPIARAIGHLDEARRGDLAIDLVGSADPSRRGLAIARLERARREQPELAAVLLALAVHCREARLTGDALELARDAASRARDDEERRTAALVAALASSVDGDGAALAHFEREHEGARRSIAVAHAVAPLRGLPGASDLLRERAHDAARTLVAAGVADPPLVLDVVLDPRSTAELRARANDALWLVDRAAARVAAQCAREGVARDACDARLALLGDGVWGEGLVSVPDLDEATLPPIELAVDPAHVSAVAEWVESASAGRLGIAPRWIRTRIVLAGRQGDVGGARALLERDGALLTAASRVALAAWLDDLAAGRAVELEDLGEALALGPALTRFATRPVDAPHVELATTEGDTWRLVAADRHLAYDDHRADAAARLRPLLDRASDRDGAVIAGWIGIATEREARARGASSEALDHAAARAHELAPGSAVDLLLDALRQQRGGDAASARGSFERALVLSPASPLLQRRWLAAWAEAEPGATADAARARLWAIDPLGVPPAVLSGAAERAGDLVDLYGVHAPERGAAFVERGGARVARAEGAWEAFRAVLRQRIARGAVGEAPDVPAMLALVEAAPASAARRRWLVRLRILASDIDGALAAADAPADEAARGDDAPLAAGDRLRAIAASRAALADPIAWALIAADELGREDPDVLVRLRALALRHPELAAVSCSEHARVLGWAATSVEICARAWRSRPLPVVAALLSEALVEAPREARAQGLEADPFFAEARDTLGDALPPVVLHREAILLARRGAHPRAAEVELDAQVRGWAPERWDGALGRVAEAGLLLRAQRARAAASVRNAELAMLALAEARLTAARLYADAAVAAVRPGARESGAADPAYAARDLVAWAATDLAAERIDRAGLAAFARAWDADLAGEDAAALASRYPESALAAYAGAVHALRGGAAEEAMRLAAVATREGVRPTLLEAVAQVARRDELESLRTRAREAFPDDPRIDREGPAPAARPVRAREAETEVAVGAGAAREEGCPLASELRRASSEAQRGALLRDAYLAASDAETRARILACADEEGPRAGALASAERAESSRAPEERAQTAQTPVAQAHEERAPEERTEVERARAERVQVEQTPAAQARAERAPEERTEVERAQAEQTPAAQARAERTPEERTDAERAHAEQAAHQAHAERARAEQDARRALAQRDAERAQAERAQAARAEAEREAQRATQAAQRATQAAQRATSAAERERLAREAEAQRAEEARRLAAEAERRAAEGEQRAAEAERRRAEAEARLAESERRAAEAERRAAEARSRAVAVGPAVAEADLRAADAERRVADAERRALEAEARAERAEREAIQEARRRAIAAAAASRSAVPAERSAVPAEAPSAVSAASAGEGPATEAIAAAEAGTAVEPAPSEEEAPVASAEVAAAGADPARTGADVGAQATQPSAGAGPEPVVRMLAMLPPMHDRASTAEAEAIAAEARAAQSVARVAEAEARAAEAEARAAEASPREAHAEVRVLEGERRAVEAEARAMEAEQREAEAARRLAEEALAAVVVAPSATADDAAAPEPASPPGQHGGLGVAAVLDDDPAAHRRGIALALVDPEGALAAARGIVTVPPRAAPTASAALPPYAAIEALVGLPHAARRALATDMMNGSDLRLRLVALAAEQVQPGTVDPDALRRTIAGDDASLAIEAARAHGLRPLAVELDAMRARLDAIGAPLEGAERVLVATLVHVLARAADRRDRPRLERAAQLLRSAAPEPGRAAEAAALAVALERDLAIHAAAAGRGATRDPALAPEVERVRRARRTPGRSGGEPSPEAVALLAREPLARVLSGTHWRAARVARPAAFFASARAGALGPAMARAAGSWAEGGDEAAAASGLDLDRPIECARADEASSAWVCVAHVVDADRVRAALAERRSGAQPAPWLVLAAADVVRGLPSLAGATPLAIDRILARDAGASTAGAAEPVIAERARADVDLGGGVVLERYARIERRDGAPTAVDAAHCLFTGDRAIFFGDEETARAVLARPPAAARALSRAARFRRITQGWADDAALRIATLDWRGAYVSTSLADRRDTSVEVVLDARGTAIVTMRSPAPRALRDVAPLAAWLPDDAVARFVAADHAPRVAARARRRAPIVLRDVRDRAELARLVGTESERLALSWSPRPGEGLWDRWLAIGEGARLDGALAGAGIAAPGEGALAAHAGGFVARRGGRWVAGAREEDVRAALERPEVAPERRPTAVGSGRLDGAAAARAVAELARALPEQDARRSALDDLARHLESARELSHEARIEGRQLVVIVRSGSAPP